MSIAKKRKASILQKVKEEDPTTVANLAAHFGVSEMTIRRDLADLESDGLIKRVHGGAVSNHGRSYEPPYALRSSKSAHAKKKIARAAVALIEDGDSVALDAGSTTFEMASELARRRELTITSPSMRIVSALLHNPDIRLIVPGGIVRTGENSLIGDLTQHAFKGLFFDKLFLAVAGIDAGAGLTEYNWDDTLVKRAMIRSAKEVFLVADASKFEHVAFAKVADLKDIHFLITDIPPPDRLARVFKELGVKVIIANEHEEDL